MIPTTEKWNLLDGYQSLPGHYDELLAESGQIREPYAFLMDSLNGLGENRFEQRRSEAARLLQENGVTYNIYASGTNAERAWNMDPLPVMISSDEWSYVESGLSQRAELLELVLRDIYSEQKLIRKKIIPPEIIFQHTGFIRAAAATLRPTSQRSLTFYAADLVRHSDGVLRVVSDRTQSPSGAGYALENRIVMSRVFPSIYRDAHVHRLALFFRAYRNQLNQFNGKSNDEVAIGLLTPGPGNETYFEHAYLASYLGLTLVQGGDLMVRNSRAYIKTVEGLQPLDVLMRRVDDSFTDPLELNSDSLLGTAGLLNCVRNGNLWIANPIGSAVLENSGIFAYLPAISRYLTGEELILPSPKTWWCANKEGQEQVRLNFENLVVRTLSKVAGVPAVYVSDLSEEKRDQLRQKIENCPAAYTVQEKLTLSTAPAWHNTGLVPRPMVLRAFLTASGNSYSVLPGGLGRVSNNPADFSVTNQHGAFSKDIWILASEPERSVSMITTNIERLSITRSSGELPSRTADNLFWLGRYAERTEGLARMLREALLRITDGLTVNEDRALQPLLENITRLSETTPGFLPEEEDEAEKVLNNPWPEMRRIIYDANVIGSIVFNLNAMVRAARSVRDRISGDGRRIINSLELLPHRSSGDDFVTDFLHEVVSSLLAFSGLNHESMTRGDAWRFMELGRRIERAINVCISTHGMLLESADEARLGALMLVHECHITYRRRYRHSMEPVSVLDLLLKDESNPRSLASQLARIALYIGELPAASKSYRLPEEKLALDLTTRIRLVDPESFYKDVPGHQSLSEFLDSIVDSLSNIAVALSNRYFNYIEQQQNLDNLDNFDD